MVVVSRFIESSAATMVISRRGWFHRTAREENAAVPFLRSFAADPESRS